MDLRRTRTFVTVAELGSVSKAATIAGLFKQLNFLGKTIVTRAEGLVSELHVGLKGTMNALLLKDLAIKTHRGNEGRVREGRSGGGRAYGYRTVVDPSQNQRGVRVIEPAEADVIRRIFQEFAAGRSPRAIAKTLNADGIAGPTGKPWRDTTIRGHATRRTGVLRNDLYVGRLVWNKQTYIRDPETGKRVARVRADSERIVTDVPGLRIVPQGLWEPVQARLDNISSSPRAEKIRSSQFWKHRRPKHLLTGLIVCGGCGGVMEAVGKDYLACRAARSGAGCQNRKGIRRSHVERVVLEALKTQLMAPDLLKAFIEGFHEELNRKSAADDQRRLGSAQELAQVTRNLKGLYQAIADGLRSPGLQKELLALEARQSELETTMAAIPPPAPRFHPRLADLYRQRVTELHEALNDSDARAEAAAILRTLVESIAVLPGEPDGHQLVLTGDIVRMLSLPSEQIPASFESSVKLVAGRGFDRDLKCQC